MNVRNCTIELSVVDCRLIPAKSVKNVKKKSFEQCFLELCSRCNYFKVLSIISKLDLFYHVFPLFQTSSHFHEKEMLLLEILFCVVLRSKAIIAISLNLGQNTERIYTLRLYEKW